MPHVVVDGHRLAYRRAGAGAPIVLLHGGWSDGRAWTRQLGSLAGDLDVVAPDIPGCGGSDDPPGRVGLDWYADAIAGLVIALDLGPVHLGGLSFGAGLALAVAQRHPRLVRSLALVGAYAGWAGSLPPDVVAGRLARLRDDLSRPVDDWAPGYLTEFFHSPVDDDELALALSMMRDVRPSGTLLMLEAFAAADLRPGLPSIEAPVLLLVGEHDVRAPVPISEALHAELPTSRLVVVPSVGHEVNVEAPERFDAEVLGFVAGPGQRTRHL